MLPWIITIILVLQVLITSHYYKAGKTALMMAAEGGHTETVKALIEAGADVNATCKQVIHSYWNMMCIMLSSPIHNYFTSLDSTSW